MQQMVEQVARNALKVAGEGDVYLPRSEAWKWQLALETAEFALKILAGLEDL